MNKGVFSEIIENGDGGEFIIEVDLNQVSLVVHFLVSGVHTELVGFDLLVVERGEDIVVGHDLDEVGLAPLIVVGRVFALGLEAGPVVRVVVQLQTFLRPILQYFLVVRVRPEGQMVQFIIQVHLIEILLF